jgi:hydrogenase maturation protein HypF
MEQISRVQGVRERRHIIIEGIVQGVGFRSFVHRLATQNGLAGFVLNNAGGIIMEVEGDPATLDNFLGSLRETCPPLAWIDRIACGVLPLKQETTFDIAASDVSEERRALIPPDTPTCDACLAELFDRKNRRFEYPFINCTNCGPRFTIIKDIPYDRERSTMSAFPMCSECQREFQNPNDRRFHAQANACADCGPNVRLIDCKGRAVSDGDPIRTSAALLQEGAIIAVKGLGGYHLACDAFNDDAVGRLRSKKRRAEKPFALMASDLENIGPICFIDSTEESLLRSSSRPIVLLRKRQLNRIPDQVAPGQDFLGVMLPYTPLHHLLLKAANQTLVMTSGNLSEEPICYRDEEALDQLGQVADYFLVHNRPIHVRCDDSVIRNLDGRELIIRRARGYAPRPISLSKSFAKPVLACGAQLKSTFCLGKERYAFLSHHIGDMENYETFTSFAEGVEHFKRLFDISPAIVAHDLHPQYLSTKYTLELKGVTRVAVQHHHAHIASCMAEHGLEGPVIGVAFDGLGYGADGAIWGGEFFTATLGHYERWGHFRYIPLAGGDTAIRQPLRSALAYLGDALSTDPVSLRLPGWEGIPPSKLSLVQAMIRQGINTVPTSACGRLFDAVASILGIRHEVNYEGQAAIELEMAAGKGIESGYAFNVSQDRCWEIDFRPAITNIIDEIKEGEAISSIAAKFHNTVVRVIIEVCRRLRERAGLSQVCLSGGTFQNIYLLEHVIPRLRDLGFEVFRNTQVPANDGGISLGQAVIANEIFRKNLTCV